MILTAALAIAGVVYSYAIPASSTLIVSLRNAAAFLWKATEHDFGKVQKGTPVTHEFTFTNNGSEPLVITAVKASCGCTVAEYTKESIPPGGKGFVKATYDAAKVGAFSKTVTINANTEEGSVQLIIKGEVIDAGC